MAFVRGISGVDHDIELLANVWFTMREYQSEEGNQWGLVDKDTLEPYPAYYAYQTLTRELEGAQYDHPLSVSGIEGYVFRLSGGRERFVLWATGGTTAMSFTGKWLRKVEKDGSEVIIQDGRTGDLDNSTNGQIRIQVTASPIFVTPCFLFGDFDCDCEVGVDDIMQIAGQWRCECGDDCYEDRFDIDGDCDIDIVDIMLVATRWGETCQ